MTKVEVEHRGYLTERKFKELNKFLNKKWKINLKNKLNYFLPEACPWDRGLCKNLTIIRVIALIELISRKVAFLNLVFVV